MYLIIKNSFFFLLILPTNKKCHRSLSEIIDFLLQRIRLNAKLPPPVVVAAASPIIHGNYYFPLLLYLC